jgi:hypothetical protein
MVSFGHRNVGSRRPDGRALPITVNWGAWPPDMRIKIAHLVADPQPHPSATPALPPEPVVYGTAPARLRTDRVSAETIVPKSVPKTLGKWLSFGTDLETVCVVAQTKGTEMAKILREHTLTRAKGESMTFRLFEHSGPTYTIEERRQAHDGSGVETSEFGQDDERAYQTLTTYLQIATDQLGWRR